MRMLPKVMKAPMAEKSTLTNANFPIDHISASSMIKFSTNPLLFKIQYINRDRFDTTMGISGIVGQAFHHAMEVYYGGSDTLIPTNESEAIEYGLKSGMDFIDKYSDGFISFSKTIPNKQKAFDYMSFCFNSYVQQMPYTANETISVEEEIKELIDVEWRGKRITLPVKLKGFIDRVVRQNGKLKIKDYKTCYAFSNLDKIDGAKIIQAVEYYLLAYAKHGEEPYSVIFEEVKYTKNSDGSNQVRQYEIVFEENDLYFDFYFRFYEDMIRALNGEMVFVPNVSTLYDNEVGIISYIHRLDVEEETAKLMKKHNVKTISELLKKEIQSAGNMRKLLKAIDDNFVTAKNIDYTKMKKEEKIQTKMMEHGMVLSFDSVINGASVDLYRFSPSIGLKMSRVRNYADDIQQVLGTTDVRVLAPIPGTTLIGFEVPTESRKFPKLPAGDGFNLAIGENVMGEIRRFDIRQAPHILIAGATGAGKSVLISSLITQLTRTPNTEMHLYDPKIVELSMHQEDRNVVEYQSDPIEIQKSLSDLVEVMNERYKILSKAGVRNVDDYKKGDMPYKFLIIDEFGDLVLSTKDEFFEYTFCDHHERINHRSKGELNYLLKTKKSLRKAETELVESVQNCDEGCKKHIYAPMSEIILKLAQKGRACGIHLIIATQRPSVDIITGSIKANFPTKIALRTSKAIDSQIILDEDGAEKLIGKGDMLFSSVGGIERLQGYSD